MVTLMITSGKVREETNMTELMKTSGTIGEAKNTAELMKTTAWCIWRRNKYGGTHDSIWLQLERKQI
jgi:hypothetical protein